MKVTLFWLRSVLVVRRFLIPGWMTAICSGSDAGPPGAILPTTVTNPLEVPTPNPQQVEGLRAPTGQ